MLVGCKQHGDTKAAEAPRAAVAAEPAKKIYDYCYSRDLDYFVCTARDTAGVHIKLSIANVQLSPDGTRLAFMDGNYPNSQTRIGLLDLTTMKSTILDTGCYKCYAPKWSPDGKYLAYNAEQGEQWFVKYIDLESGHTAVVASKERDGRSFYPNWSQDSKKIVVQKDSGIVIFDLKGNVLRKVAFSSMDTTLQLDHNNAILLTAGEDKLIFDCEVTNDEIYDEDDGHFPLHLFSYDLNTRKLTWLGPRNFACDNPALKGDTIFCDAYKRRGDGTVNIYRMGLAGDDFRLVFRNSYDLSCRIH